MFWAIEAVIGAILVIGTTMIVKAVNAEWDITPKGKHRKG